MAKSNLMACIPVLAVVLVCGGGMAVTLKSVIELKLNGVKSEGYVTFSGSRFLKVEYKDGSGNVYKASGAPLMFGDLESGAAVDVLYFAGHPEEGCVNTWEDLYVTPVAFELFFLASLAALRTLIKGSVS